MRRILSLILLVCLLTGCKGEESLIAQAISFRGELISRGGCSFLAKITADYGEDVQQFSLNCEADRDGRVSFSVTEPESIGGISGSIEGEDGLITYDGLQLAFPLLVSEQISPVSAPALTMKCWIGEYILSAGMSDGIYRVSYEKKINGKDLLIDTYFEKDIPISAELCYNGYRIIRIEIMNFSFA